MTAEELQQVLRDTWAPPHAASPVTERELRRREELREQDQHVLSKQAGNHSLSSS